MILGWALYLSGPARWIEWSHFAASRIRSLALADSGHLDRGQHWVIFECRHLPRATWHVGEQAKAFVLPRVS